MIERRPWPMQMRAWLVKPSARLTQQSRCMKAIGW
jgi:hypothetical protein